MMNEKMKKNWDLSESEGNKTLYLCFGEQHPGRRVSYVVRSIKLSQLLRSDDDSVLQLNNVGYKAADGHLATSVGCGVFGSQILFASGITPGGITPATIYRVSYRKDVYAFETDSRKQPASSDILKMDAKLLYCKEYPIVVVLGGKLIALSYRERPGSSFEVFDPEIKAWHVLPEPPIWRQQSWNNSRLGYAVIGSKMFVSYGTSPVYCFDIAQENRVWRRVDSMCGPFNFYGEALVLDLAGHPTKKLMFACNRYLDDWKLGSYIMFLDEGRESITQIARCSLPALPPEFDYASCYYILHIGGQKGCLVAPQLSYPYPGGEGPLCGEVGSHKTTGVVVPFEFQVDFNKIDEDTANSLTLDFMPTRVFQFYTGPSTYPQTDPHGCFIL